MFRLSPLPYAPDALAPTISETTMLTHHGKHHAKYVETTNALVTARAKGFPPLEAVVRLAATAGDAKLFNNAGQAWNHAFFWTCMTPRQTPVPATLRSAVEASFGDLEALKAQFVSEGVGHFGSGWVWLIAHDETLAVITTHDGDTALMRAGTPLLVCDLWEHAYYLDHKNDRAGFLNAWWDRLVNWSFVAAQYEAARSGREAWCYADAEQKAEA